MVEEHPHSRVTSDEVDALVYAYLKESGYAHTSFSLLHESTLSRPSTSTLSSTSQINGRKHARDDPDSILGQVVPPGHLDSVDPAPRLVGYAIPNALPLPPLPKGGSAAASAQASATPPPPTPGPSTTAPPTTNGALSTSTAPPPPAPAAAPTPTPSATTPAPAPSAKDKSKGKEVASSVGSLTGKRKGRAGSDKEDLLGGDGKRPRTASGEKKKKSVAGREAEREKKEKEKERATEKAREAWESRMEVEEEKEKSEVVGGAEKEKGKEKEKADKTNGDKEMKEATRSRQPAPSAPAKASTPAPAPAPAPPAPASAPAPTEDTKPAPPVPAPAMAKTASAQSQRKASPAPTPLEPEARPPSSSLSPPEPASSAKLPIASLPSPPAPAPSSPPLSSPEPEEPTPSSPPKVSEETVKSKQATPIDTERILEIKKEVADEVGVNGSKNGAEEGEVVMKEEGELESGEVVEKKDGDGDGDGDGDVSMGLEEGEEGEVGAAPPEPSWKNLSKDDGRVIRLKGHTVSKVQPCSWNPKVPALLATGGGDSTCRIWDVPTPSKQGEASQQVVSESVVCKHSSAQRRADVGAVAWDPSGSLLATGSEDGIARIWTPSGDLHLVLSMHQRTIFSLKWNSLGTMLLTGSLDNTVCLWNVNSGKVQQQWSTHSDSVLDVDWNDDHTFASASMDKSIHLFNTSRVSPLNRFKGHRDEVNVVKFSPCGTLLASCSDDKTVRVWSLKGIAGLNLGEKWTSKDEGRLIDDKEHDGVLVLKGHSSDVHTLAWAPKNSAGPRTIASASFDNTTKLWNADTGECLHTFKHHTDFVYSVSFMPGLGEYLAVGSNDSKLTVWDVKEKKLKLVYENSGPIYEISWHPAGTHIASIMPNAHRSGAARKKAKAAASKGASSSSAGSNGFVADPSFSFSSPHPTFPPSPSSSSQPKKTKASYFAPTSSDDSEDDSEHYSDDDAPDADEEDQGPPEKPDEELTPEEALARAEERKEAGNVFFKKKDYPSATRLYTQAIALAPTNPAYLTNRAASYMASRQYSKALGDCLSAAQLQKADPQPKTLLRLAKCQLALGLVYQAQQTLDQLLPLDASPAVMAERAKAARIQTHVANVKREMEKKEWSMVLLGIDAAAREVEETPREWRLWKVEALVGKKKYDEAAGMAADLLRANPQQPEALYYRGLSLYYNGNHAQAIAHCQEALRNDPDFTLARTLLRKVKLLDSLKDAGNDAFKNNRLQEAIDKYTEGLEVDPENDSYRSTLLSNRATAYQKLKEPEKALADCDACLEINPSYFKALRTRARVHLSSEDFEAAMRDFKQAYELAPAGSADETSLKRELKDAEVKLKKSKMKDHYKTLGIQSDATDDEIKKAYRRQSLIHHPDKGGSDEKFKEIGEAYAILSDPVRRRKFDSGIDESDPMSGMGSDFGDMGGFPGGHPFASGGVNFEDMFGGGGFGGGGFSSGGFGGGGYGGRRGNPYGF
ncbi:DnaJ family protein [Pseudohyphozyma bogoriensis]|nr:DnaJ family protein [Pseudohyphozyma bogoriensis]